MKATNMARVINIGKFPPPVGGISYFLKRLKQHMDSAQRESVFIDVSNVDTQKKEAQGVWCMSLLKTFLWLLFTKHSVVVFHSNRLPVLVGSYLLSYRHKIVIFTHGESILKNADRKKCFLLNRVTALVAPIRQLADRIRKTYPEYADKVFHIPFILFPPNIRTINHPDIQRIRSSHKTMLSAYAYDIKPMNGVDLYGVDMLIDLMCSLRDADYDVGMVLVLPACSESEFAKERLSRIHEEKLDNIFFVYRNRLEEATDLFALSDIYVRPSSSDGDSFAVWEALHVGTPVVTSDVVARPKGCQLFRNRDQMDFVRVTKNVIDNYPASKNAVLNLNVQGSEKILLSFFEEISES